MKKRHQNKRAQINEDYKHCPKAVIHSHSGLFKEIKEAFFCFSFLVIFYFDTKALNDSRDEITALQLSLWTIVGLLLITDLDSFHCSVSAAKRRLLFIHQSLHPVRGSRWRCGSVCLQPPLCLSVLTGRCRCEVLLSRISMLTSEEQRQICRRVSCSATAEILFFPKKLRGHAMSKSAHIVMYY